MPFKTDKNKSFMALQVITVCAEEYRYNLQTDCAGYRQSVQILDELFEFEVAGQNKAK